MAMHDLGIGIYFSEMLCPIICVFVCFFCVINMKLCLQFVLLLIHSLIKKLYLNKSYNSYIINHGSILVRKVFLRLEDLFKK